VDHRVRRVSIADRSCCANLVGFGNADPALDRQPTIQDSRSMAIAGPRAFGRGFRYEML
jgi:hypothetical protein